MADEIPADLIATQRAFYDAEAEVEKKAAALPSSVAIVSGTLTDEQQTKLPSQREALAKARAVRDTVFAKLKAHEWWEQPEQKRDQFAAWKALQAAAKAPQA